MDTFIKVLLIIYLVIWIAIGSLFIAGGVAVITLVGKYGPAVTGLVSGGGAGALGSLVGGEAMQKLADPKERMVLYKTLSTKQKTCLEQAVGAAEVQRVLTEKNYQPRPDLLIKASGCFQ